MNRRLIAALVATMAGSCPTWACPGANVSGAWVRSPPPGMTMTAAYFELQNVGTTPLVVESISSADFGSVMLHETVYHDGTAGMRHLAGLTLPPGETFRAIPGGVHVMVGDPHSDLRTVKAARFELHCAGGSSLSYSAPVLRSAPGAGAAH